MSDRPILFSAAMVQALMAGRKTQTRRTLRLPDSPSTLGTWEASTIGGAGVSDSRGRPVAERPCVWHTRTAAVVEPRFCVGDRLWVKETWRAGYGLDFYRDDLGRCPRPSDMDPATTAIEYLADGDRELGGKTRVSIHMPRWASRLTLTVTDVRVERLQDCSEADAIAEGVRALPGEGPNHFTVDVPGWAISAPTAVETYRLLWNWINGEGAWEANPWVTAISFTVEQRNIGT